MAIGTMTFAFTQLLTGYNNIFRLGIDGRVMVEKPREYAYNMTPGDLIIGADDISGTHGWQGLIDELAIWDRALSRDEWGSLFKTTSANFHFMPAEHYADTAGITFAIKDPLWESRYGVSLPSDTVMIGSTANLDVVSAAQASMDTLQTPNGLYIVRDSVNSDIYDIAFMDFAQQNDEGCTDPSACNFDPQAEPS